MNTLITVVAVINLSLCGGVKTGRLLGLESGINDALVEVDIDTGEVTFLHYYDVKVTEGGLAVGPDGTLYAAFCGSVDQLMILDPDTGSLTYVGPFGFDDVSALAFGPDGTLYGFDEVSDHLITIDPLTGQGTAIGFVVIDGNGLAFTPDGTLYLVGSPVGGARLYTVDPDTGDATEIGLLGSDFTSPGGLTAIGDVLYGDAREVEFGCGSLVILDRETGDATKVGHYSPDCILGGDTVLLGGLTFLPGPGDADRDGDVDLDDFAFFQSCFTGPLGTESPSPPGCRFMDADGDNDADMHDFAIFQAAFTGPNDPDE